ncbi:helix-turn-helix domain-containing protein [Klebsiella aerogenes]|uniref:helix-turn-helix domain-containing protein n=1 Tax=Klebsiella aerogenes TaxID=548 RepID=UPI00351CE89F
MNNLSHLETEKIYSEMDFSELDRLLEKFGRKLYFDKGVTLQPKNGEVLVIIEGRMSISNGLKEGLMLGHTFLYMPVGIPERYYNLPLYYRAESPVKAVQLTSEEADEVFFSTPERAILFSKIMAFICATLVHVYYERNNDSGYATIREMLQRYMFKVENDTIGSESIAAFILARTRLSRSYVFQILAGLKSGGYISVRKGRLISINRDIPERF